MSAVVLPAPVRPPPPPPEPDQVDFDVLVRWAQRQDPVRWALGAMVVGWSLIFIHLGFQRHDRFGTFGFDLGIYDQAIWLLSRFKDPFVTIRGLHYFEHHVNLITVLFVPAYWLGAGPSFLYLVETVWMALGAVPLFLLARDRLRSGWLAVAVAGCFLLYPSLERIAGKPDRLAELWKAR